MTTTKPLVSIIMPAYNAATFIEKCLDTICSQTFSNWELIIVDDFSTDSTATLIKDFIDKHQLNSNIRLLPNEKKGIISALRLAYSHCAADYITRMDADDTMDPRKLELLYEKASQNKDSCITAYVEYFSDGLLRDGYIKYAAWLNSLIDDESHFKNIYKECVVPSPCWMMHRRTLDAINAFEPERYPEDYDLCFRLYQQNVKIIGIKEILHFWRDHQTRASRNDPNYMDQHFLGLKLHYFTKLDYNPDRELCLWGAGKTGKLWARALIEKGLKFRWFTSNPNKIGHNISGVVLENEATLHDCVDSQIISAIKQKGFAETNHDLLQNLLKQNQLYAMY